MQNHNVRVRKNDSVAASYNEAVLSKQQREIGQAECLLRYSSKTTWPHCNACILKTLIKRLSCLYAVADDEDVLQVEGGVTDR